MWPLGFLVSVWDLGFQVSAWPPVEQGSSAIAVGLDMELWGGVATGEQLSGL